MGNDQNTDPNQVPGATGGKDENPPAATNQDKGNGAANGGDDNVTLKREDYNNLISQRDKNHNAAELHSDFVQTLEKREAIDNYIKENAEKYPDVTRDDLMHLEDPELLDQEAQRIQRRFQDVVQNKLKNVQRASAPQLSAQDKAEKEKALRKSGDKDAFEQMVNLRTSPTSSN